MTNAVHRMLVTGSILCDPLFVSASAKHAEDDITVPNGKRLTASTLPAVRYCADAIRLATPTTVESATTAYLATVESGATMNLATMDVGDGTASFKATPLETARPIKTAGDVRTMSIESAASIDRINRMSPTVIPRSGPDKYTPGEPGRAVIPVRSAAVRIIRIVAVSANRGSAHVPRTNPYAHANPNLRLRVSQRQNHQHSEQSQIAHILHGAKFIERFHIEPPSSDSVTCRRPSVR